MNDEVWKAALAGLLHDIGKFAQRAQGKPWDRPPSFDEGKEVYGKSGFHALWSGWFAKEYIIRDWLAGYDLMTHHKPNSSAAYRISLADWLSAWEREPPEEEAAEKDGNRQMLSVFCRLMPMDGDTTTKPQECYWPLGRLCMERESLFPGPAMSEAEQKKAYQSLWAEFLEWASKARGIRDHFTLIEQYMGLLQYYTWCIPSAFYKNEPDVSLYDHSRMTAALAACLSVLSDDLVKGLRDALLQTDFGKAGFSSPAGKLLTDTTVALLVGGDISGVQDFIYTISSKGAAGALRGRSAYLQLLTEAVARYVLRRLELPITNLVYAGGGHFFLLAPPGDETMRRLQAIKTDISRLLLAAHSGDLYLAVEHAPIAAADLHGRAFSQKWSEVTQLLKRAKDRRFSELCDGLKELFTPPDHGGNEDKVCSVCHREHKDTTVVEGQENRPASDRVKKCPMCRSFEDLGDDLRRAEAVWLTEVDWAIRPPADLTQGWQQALSAFGLLVTISSAPTDSGLTDARKVMWALADGSMDARYVAERQAVVRRLWVNVTPLLTESDVQELRGKPEFREERLGNGFVKPFSVMNHQARGIQRLGVLRMDMDHAGKLISQGLGERATLSRQAALSFALTLYFEGWLGKLAEVYNGDPARGNNRIYSIYSGGDDLFFIGSWDAMPGLALEIRNDLAAFVGGREDIHLSAGIAVVESKYPLYQAAADAHDALDAAKSSGRNAISFLGQTMKWPDFVRNDVPGYAAGWKAEKLRPLVRLLLVWHKVYDEERQKRRKADLDLTLTGEEQLLWGPWMWRAAYMLSRMAKVQSISEQQRQNILEVKEKLRQDFRAIDWMGLAALWADLLGRPEKSEQFSDWGR